MCGDWAGKDAWRKNEKPRLRCPPGGGTPPPVHPWTDALPSNLPTSFGVLIFATMLLFYSFLKSGHGIAILVLHVPEGLINWDIWRKAKFLDDLLYGHR